MHWANEIVESSTLELPGNEALPEGEMKMARMLIDTMSVQAFEPEKFKNKYHDELLTMIEARAQGKELPKAKKAAAPRSKVVNLMDVLAQSLEESKKRRAGNGRAASNDKPERKRRARAARNPLLRGVLACASRYPLSPLRHSRSSVSQNLPRRSHIQIGPAAVGRQAAGMLAFAGNQFSATCQTTGGSWRYSSIGLNSCPGVNSGTTTASCFAKAEIAMVPTPATAAGTIFPAVAGWLAATTLR